jgi:hypothetical protein
MVWCKLRVCPSGSAPPQSNLRCRRGRHGSPQSSQAFRIGIHDGSGRYKYILLSLSHIVFSHQAVNSLPQQRTKPKHRIFHFIKAFQLQSNLLSQKHSSHSSQSNPTKIQWPQQCTAHLSPAPPALPTPPSPLNHPPPPASAPSIPTMVKAGNSQPHTHHPASTPRPSSPSQPSAGPNTAATQEVSMSTSRLRTSSPSNRPPVRRLHSRAASTPKTAKESISRARTRAANRARHHLLPAVLGNESVRLEGRTNGFGVVAG